jgi:alkanesulfonate monooxygenase SsuD/methylene tetrahydromethanopterin reductase-like flavin-dependent oxidoreductase (luciferase family)
MKFGLFFEHQLPRPWSDSDEQNLYSNALDQCEAADRLGYHYLWEVEHHFLEEYSHSSAPEVFLAAASQRTKNIRLGHGVRLMPPPYNHPVRVAEQLATLDLVSGGRVEWGTGTSASRVELEGFGVPFNERHAMWETALRECVKMMTAVPYPGYRGKYFNLPARNIIPKPIQKPHPPLWLASASLAAVEVAARHGMGALAFRPLTADEARVWVDRYYEILATECVPIGASINANIAVVSGFGCARTREHAIMRFAPGLEFYDAALAHFYRFGRHRPGQTNLSAQLKRARPFLRAEFGREPSPVLDSPEGLRELFESYERAGVDQLAFFHQAGRSKHEHILEALELFGTEAMPAFLERDANAAEKKAARLEGVFERAFARKPKEEEPREAEPIDALTRAEYSDLLARLRKIIPDI